MSWEIELCPFNWTSLSRTSHLTLYKFVSPPWAVPETLLLATVSLW